jgi:integrase
MPLTVKQVQSAKPGRHADGKGLYLLVKPTGARSWVLRVQHRGQRRDFGLGSVALDRVAVDESLVPLARRRSLTLAEAREKARIGRELAKAGINPSAEWRAEELTIPTFRAAAEEYHAAVAKAWRNGKHSDQWLSTLKTHVFPNLGERLVSDIGAAEIHAVLLPIWLTIPETARRVRQRIAVVLDYAHGKGWRETEAPTRAVNKLLGGIKQPPKGNFASMPYAEVPAFMAKLREAEATVGRMALQFAILCAGRSGEVRHATWGEFDLDAAEWRIPGSRMKAGKMHIEPLTDAALEILQQLRGLFGGKPSDLVFPGLKGKAMSENTMNKALRGAGGDKATVHGFRSSFTDWAADHGYPDAWVEAALSHSNQDKTQAAYRRTSYFEQRREKLMPAWARYVTGDASNVVALAERRA